VRVNWKDLGLGGACSIRDLWARKDIGTTEEGSTFQVKPHGAGLYRVMQAGR
jgi:alpha-galactosidase